MEPALKQKKIPQKGVDKDFSHKVPSGDGPYVRAKHAQLVHKDAEGAIIWFLKAINEGDRVESALKDMALVLKQLNRMQEAIEAIENFRGLCPRNAQESLDNVLIDLYRKCGKIDEQIELLKHKLKLIHQGELFNGKPTKTARSHGKKFQLSVKQETSRILGNLAWAYMQKPNLRAAEAVYRKAQMIEPDANKALNLCNCLFAQGRFDEAEKVLDDVLQYKIPGSTESKLRDRAEGLALQLLKEKQSQTTTSSYSSFPLGLGLWSAAEGDFGQSTDGIEWAVTRSRRLPIFEEITQYRDQMAC